MPVAPEELDVDELVEEIRGLSPVMARQHAEDLRAHIQRMERSPHAVASDPRTPAGEAPPGEKYCFQCHGDDFEHFFQIGEDISSDGANAVCLECHSGGDRMHWQGGAHEFQDMACVDCHNLHNNREGLLHADTQLETCSSCHIERRVDFNRPSHHPVTEGQVECTDCHNPHGTTGPRLLRAGDVNDTCYGCHAEKRGPFLWEHQPVREDCTNCHNPHGSSYPALLKSQPVQLCQSCHLTATDHPGDLLGPNDPNTGGRGQFQVVGRGCLNCHSQVHGSNHPGGSHFQR